MGISELDGDGGLSNTSGATNDCMLLRALLSRIHGAVLPFVDKTRLELLQNLFPPEKSLFLLTDPIIKHGSVACFRVVSRFLITGISSQLFPAEDPIVASWLFEFRVSFLIGIGSVASASIVNIC